MEDSARAASKAMEHTLIRTKETTTYSHKATRFMQNFKIKNNKIKTQLTQIQQDKLAGFDRRNTISRMNDIPETGESFESESFLTSN